MGLLATGQAMADALVLRASGPDARQHRVGSRLPDGTRVTLRQGDRLLLLVGRGTRSLEGPTTFVVGAERPPSASTRAVFLQRGLRRLIGGVRGDAQTEAQIRDLTAAATAADAGDYTSAERLLQQVGRAGYTHKVQCRLADNLRLRIAVAKLDKTPPQSHDPCGELLMPRNLSEVLVELDEERRQYLEVLSGL